MDTSPMESPNAHPAVSVTPSQVDEIEAPPLHPRVPQLIQLEVAKIKRREELAEIEKECEAAAEPFALEIEHLEDRLSQVAAEGLVLDGRRESLTSARARHLEAMERVRLARAAEDAEFAAAAKRIDDDTVEAEHALAAIEKEEGSLRDALNVQREKFDAARTTSKGRAIERAIRKINQQQEKIVARNPGARYYLLEMAIAAEAERQGYGEKVRAVGAGLRDPKFGPALTRAVSAARGVTRAEPSEFEIKVMSEDILHEMGISTADVDLHVTYNPPNVSVMARGIDAAARTRCLTALRVRPAAKPEGAATAA